MVVIAEGTRRLLGNLFELQDRGPSLARDVKGIAGPTRAWAALRVSSVESRFEAMHATGLTSLVGREEEAELLVRRWSRAKTGEGQVVLVAGEAGIGKSRLTAAFSERIATEPHTRLRYFCSPQHTDSALYPFIVQLERAADFARNDTAEGKLAKLEALLAPGALGGEEVALIAELLSLPVRFIVGFPAGNASDILARLTGQWFSERLAQNFVIENRPGAGGSIGTEVVVVAPPDGYTLLLVVASHAMNAALYKKLNFNFIRDIAPVASICGNPYVMVVTPSFPAKTVPEFIAYAKSNPGKINMGSAGIGGPTHVFGELFKATTGVDLVHVPYRGSFVPDLLGGQVQVALAIGIPWLRTAAWGVSIVGLVLIFIQLIWWSTLHEPYLARLR
jgi:hypothetical protein